MIPLDKLEGYLDEYFGLSDGENSEDGCESDENENEAVFVEPTQQELIDVLEGNPANCAANVPDLDHVINQNLPSPMGPIAPEEESELDSDPECNISLHALRNRWRGFHDDMSDTEDENDENWKKVFYPHTPPIESFDDRPLRPSQVYPIRSSPLAYFSSFFSQEVINHILEQTNLYASQNRQKDWEDVTIAEMKAFLGMLVLMGVHPLPNVDLYWSSDPLFRVDEIANIMTCKRFKKILKNLHLNNNTNMPKRGEAGFDKLYKIRPMISLMNTAFKNSANNTASQSIDECMIKFKGRSTLKQYMPKKPVKRGFKVWARCDSQTGYLFEFEIYTGKKENESETGLGAAVVKNLCKELIDENLENVHVAFDNFFASTELLQDLYQQKIYATATVRPNRTNLPQRIKPQKAKKGQPKKPILKLKKGQFKWRVNGNVGAFVWMDTKPVYVLSTAFFPKDKATCNRTQKDGSKEAVVCPMGILEYTKRMGGVDRFDQKRGTYPVARRSRRWWMRIFYFFIDAAITNAYILYTQNSRVRYPVTNLQFRTMLGRNLVDNFTSRKRTINSLPTFVTKRPTPDSRQKTVYGVPETLRLADVGTHLPGELPKYRRCRYCSSKGNSKKSKIECVRCRVALCAVPCFADFHQT